MRIKDAERISMLSNGDHVAVKTVDGRPLALCIVGASVFQYATLDDWVAVVPAAASVNGGVKDLRKTATRRE
jgi:hypothetical protein